MITEFEGTDGVTRENFNSRIKEANAHISDTNNPHGTNAEQTGAVPKTGGTMTGNLNMQNNVAAINLQTPSGNSQTYISNNATDDADYGALIEHTDPNGNRTGININSNLFTYTYAPSGGSTKTYNVITEGNLPTAEQVGAIPSSEKGVADGVATLNANGNVEQQSQYSNTGIWVATECTTDGDLFRLTIPNFIYTDGCQVIFQPHTLSTANAYTSILINEQWNTDWYALRTTHNEVVPENAWATYCPVTVTILRGVYSDLGVDGSARCGTAFFKSADYGTASDTTSIASAITRSTSDPSTVGANGTLWAVTT